MEKYFYYRFGKTKIQVKTVHLPVFFVLSLFIFGCNLTERFGARTNANQNSGVSATQPSPPPTTAAPSPGAQKMDEETAPAEDLRAQRNLLAFSAGTLIVDKTSESSEDKARYAIDEASFYWQTEDGRIENQSITLELPAPTVLKTIGFDTSQPTYYDNRAAKDVLVEVSQNSPVEGFQKILAATLTPDKDGQNFPVEREIAARFVRVTAINNHGSSKRILIKEVRGYGEQEPRAQIPNVSGTYSFGDFGELHLKHEGASVVGCYQYNEGVVEGTIDGRALSLVRTEAGGATRGFAVVNFVENGKKIISTVWEQGKSKDYDVLKTGEKKSDRIGNCKHFANLDASGKDAAKDKLAENLEKQGRAVLYGINFDFNSDKIRDESRPTLNKVVSLLKEKNEWRLTVEGHTDNVGGAEFNQMLSEKRAAAVRNYLTNAGIDAARLNSAGLGFTKPVAANDSEAGRAQNRRVELLKQ
ncbi:MAG: OmpA family protein [Acidobacteriota bacterium]|nr:OmpA family protein [Acidobacteriota bacterium]